RNVRRPDTTAGEFASRRYAAGLVAGGSDVAAAITHLKSEARNPNRMPKTNCRNAWPGVLGPGIWDWLRISCFGIPKAVTSIPPLDQRGSRWTHSGRDCPRR